MWLLLGLGAAFFDAAKNILSKYSTQKFNPFIVAWSLVMFNAMITLPIALISGIPHLDSVFWIALVCRTVLDIIAISLSMFAIRDAEVSKVLPLFTLQTVVALFTSIPLNHEFPSLAGLIGVVLILTGVYLLYKEENHEKFLDPFRALFKNRSAMLMIIACVIWGLVGSLHKLAIVHSSALFYTGFGTFILALCFLPIVLLLVPRQQIKGILSREGLSLVPMGIVDGLMTLCLMLAQSVAITVYVTAVYQISLLFSSLYAAKFMHEKIKGRVVPIVLMLIGVIIIGLA